MQRIHDLIDDEQPVTKAEFTTLMFTLFPEIREVSGVSKEGQSVVNDSITCLFNSFDLNKSKSLSYKKLSSGFSFFCWADDSKYSAQ